MTDSLTIDPAAETPSPVEVYAVHCGGRVLADNLSLPETVAYLDGFNANRPADGEQPRAEAVPSIDPAALAAHEADDEVFELVCDLGDELGKTKFGGLVLYPDPAAGELTIGIDGGEYWTESTAVDRDGILRDVAKLFREWADDVETLLTKGEAKELVWVNCPLSADVNRQLCAAAVLADCTPSKIVADLVREAAGAGVFSSEEVSGWSK